MPTHQPMSKFFGSYCYPQIAKKEENPPCNQIHLQSILLAPTAPLRYRDMSSHDLSLISFESYENSFDISQSLKIHLKNRTVSSVNCKYDTIHSTLEIVIALKLLNSSAFTNIQCYAFVTMMTHNIFYCIKENKEK